MNLAQKRKAQERDRLRRQALNNGTASPSQQMESARVIRTLEKRIAELEKLIYSEEL